MLKSFSYLLFILIFYTNKIFFFLFRRNFIGWLIFFLEEKTYRKVSINNKNKINFFIPNNLIDWRVRTIFSKEPDTIKWIDNFNSNKKIIFWDIGANIGLYSIYAACKHKENIKVISFEPSSSNLRVLTRNISINNLSDKIFINQIALTNKKNIFLDMNEPEFIEGSSLNSFGEKIDFEGNEFSPNQRYKIFGTSIDFMIDEKILEIPDYIKIDVDGIEHLILDGGDKLFQSENLKSILIEINENFSEQKNSVLNFMKTHNFEFQKKKNYPDNLNSKFKNTYNYIFIKNGTRL
tara:strand:+ start:1737 stop:2615 length:879 start_codon:yes stop_codon:yes gene_type:complete